MRGGRLREVVAKGGLTVLRLDKVCLDFSKDALLSARLVMKCDMQISKEIVSNAHVHQLIVSLYG